MLWLLLLAPMTDAQIESAIKRAPQDVRALIERRQGCNHWLGESPYDEDRNRQINAAVSELRCKTLDQDTEALRIKYKSNANVITLINQTVEWSY